MSGDNRNNKANEQEAQNCSIVGFSQQEAKVSLTADLRKNLPMVIMWRIIVIHLSEDCFLELQMKN